MRSKRFAILIGLLILLAVGTMALAQPGAGAQTKVEKAAKGHGEVAIEMLIQLPESPDGTETSVGDLVTKISNIGSSGQD